MDNKKKAPKVATKEIKKAKKALNAEEEKVESMPTNSAKVYFVIPFAAINAGKSYVWEAIQQVLGQEKQHGKWSFSSVSSDKIRAQETERLLSEGKLTKESAFNKSAAAAGRTYKAELLKLIKATSALQDDENHIIFLDKNHPADKNIHHVTSLIDDEMPQGIRYLKAYLIP